MPRWLKIVLLLFLLGIVGIFGTCGAFMWWTAENAPELRARAEKAMQDGEKLGASSDQRSCVDEVVKRAAACDELSVWKAGECTAMSKAFGHACLKAAPQDPSLCKDLPRGTALLDVARWGTTTCEEKGAAGSQGCGRAIMVIMEHCQAQKAGAPAP